MPLNINQQPFIEPLDPLPPSHLHQYHFWLRVERMMTLVCGYKLTQMGPIPDPFASWDYAAYFWGGYVERKVMVDQDGKVWFYYFFFLFRIRFFFFSFWRSNTYTTICTDQVPVSR